MKKSIGVNRLAIFIGLIGVFAWFSFVFVASKGFHEVGLEDFIVLIIGSIVAFAIPFLFVKGIFWVKDGFSRDKTVE